MPSASPQLTNMSDDPFRSREALIIPDGIQGLRRTAPLARIHQLPARAPGFRWQRPALCRPHGAFRADRWLLRMDHESDPARSVHREDHAERSGQVRPRGVTLIGRRTTWPHAKGQ